MPVLAGVLFLKCLTSYFVFHPVIPGGYPFEYDGKNENKIS
jgi:hypothetical protein